MRVFLVLGGLAAIALFLGLDRLDWVDEREARDAAVARELVERRELLLPTLGGDLRFEKPLLAYGLEAAGAALTPGSPAGPRAVKAGLAIALVLLTAVIGSRTLGPRAGAMAGAVLASCLALPVAARSDGTQLLATLLAWIGWAGLARASLGGGGPRGLAMAYLALATAFVTCGPLTALWPLAAVALARSAPPRRLHAWAGLLTMVGLALPWYGAMVERSGLDFVAALPAFPYGGEPGGAWYAAPARMLGFLVVGFFPWSTLLAAAALYRWTGAGAADSKPTALTRLLVVTLGVAVIPILFAPAAPLPAALPALPAAALLVGALLDRALSGEPLARRAVAQSTWLVAGSGTVASILLLMISRRLGGAAPEMRLVASFLFLAAWAPALAAFIGRTRAVPALLACVVALGVPLVAWRTLPALEGHLSAGPIGVAMNGVSAKDAPLVLVESPPASLRLRLERRHAVPDPLAPALDDYRGSDGWTYLAYPPRRQSEVAKAAAPAPLEILMRTPALVLARVGGR